MKNEIVVEKVVVDGIDTIKADEVTAKFKPQVVELLSHETEYIKIMASPLTDDLCKQAGILKRKLVKIRTGSNVIHKTEKETSKKIGQYIDGWRNSIKKVCEGVEDKLEAVEKYFINLKAAEEAKLETKRTTEYEKYIRDGDSIPANLGGIPEETWQVYLTGVKTLHDNRIKEAEEVARIKAEKEAVIKLEADRRLETTLLSKFIPEYVKIIFADLSKTKYKALIKDAEILKSKKIVEKIDKKEEKLTNSVYMPEVHKEPVREIGTYSKLISNAKKASKAGQDLSKMLLENKKMKAFIEQHNGLWVINKDPKTVTLDWIRKNAFQLGLNKY